MKINVPNFRSKILINSRSGRSPDWLKMKNADAPAVKREAEEDWVRKRRTRRTPAEGGAAMDKDYLLLKRTALIRPSGEWSDDDYDVLAQWRCR